MSFERMKVTYNGRATTVSMDAAIFEIISRMKGGKPSAVHWIRHELVGRFQQTDSRSPSLSRRVQAACVQEIARFVDLANIK